MLVLSYDYPPTDGGISRLGAGIVAELARRGVKTEVVTLRSGSKDGPARPPALHREVAPVRGRRELETLHWLFKAHRDDVVLATVWNPEASLAHLARRRCLTILAHGNEVMPYQGKPLKERVRRYVLEHAKAVVCNSRYTENLVRVAAPAARTCVIHPAVEAVRFSGSPARPEARTQLGLPHDKRILLSVSRLDQMKGHSTILRALGHLSAGERAKLCYVIAGRGPHEAALRALSAELDLESVVRFAGFVNDTDLPILYAAADLFALCSAEDRRRNAVEGFGMVFAEAQAAGLAVIGTRSGGIPDAIREGEGGWLMAENDQEALAFHLRRLINDVKFYHLEGCRGRARVLRELGWPSYVDALLKVA
jgi:phosphatidyl-myo-inositol dimannoside synthase